MRALPGRFLALFRKRRIERELEDEISLHLALLEEQFVARGMAPEEARGAARREFGGVDQVKETWRDRRGLPSLEAFLRDLRYGARGLRRSPAFAAAAVLSLALGMGANVAVFSLFNALLLRMLPVSNAWQLVSIYRTGGWGRGYASYPLYLELRGRKDLFEGVLARSGVGKVRFSAGGADRADFAQRELVSGDYFEVLGVKPALGRLLNPDDNRTVMGHPLAVLSYDFWRARFGGDPAAIGRTIHVDEQPLTVIGVAEPRFHGVEADRRAEIWAPAMMYSGKIMDPRMHWAWLLGRRRTDRSVAQLQAALQGFMQAHLNAVYGNKPNNAMRRMAMTQRLEVRPGGIGISLLREEFEKPLRILLAVVMLVLVAACANLANLMLARGAARRRELALRFSLGAGRARIVRQMLAESLLVALLGASLGLAFAVWGARALLLFLPGGADATQLDVHPDATVLGFTALSALAATILFGLLPAFRSTALDPAAALKQSGAARAGVRVGLRKALVVLQVAVSVVLVVAAGLFARSLSGLESLDPGFRNRSVLGFYLSYPNSYKPKQQAELRDRAIARLSSLPGVLSVSYGFPGPYRGGTWSGGFRIPGSEKTAHEAPSVDLQLAAPRYFETIGSPPLRGREFDARDTADSTSVAIVNEAFAREYFGTLDVAGRVLSFDDAKPQGGKPTYIVGVVRNIRHQGLRQRIAPTVYGPPGQFDTGYGLVLLVRSETAILPALRREVSALDPALGVVDPRSFDQRIGDSIYQDRMLAVVGVFFGGLALLLAGVGVYGVIAYTVTQRTAEIGVRIALGAPRRSVIWMVLREGLLLIAAGIAVGLPVSMAAARVAGSLLYGIRPGDPATIALTALVLMAAGAAAVLAPARRAAAVDPAQALRHE